jgi:hypothetical protein
MCKYEDPEAVVQRKYREAIAYNLAWTLFLIIVVLLAR